MPRNSKKAAAGRQEAPTIYTLAEISGFSVGTVSRALNGDPLIKENTRKKIKLLAQQCHYRKSSLARNLSLQKSGEIAVLLPNTANPVYAQLTEFIVEQAQKNNYTVSLHYSECDFVREAKLLSDFTQMSADGFIVFPSFEHNKSALLALANRKPVALRGFIDANFPLDCVYVDFEQGAVEAVNYLIAAGHREISFASALDCFRGPSERLSGFMRAIAAAGLRYSDRNFMDIGATITSAYEKSLVMLKKKHSTALVVQSDYLAFGVMRAIVALGLKIPEDISIVSFDNIEFSAYGVVPLTTMEQPVRAQAELLTKILLERIAGADSARQYVKLNTRMVIRSSVAIRNCKK